MRWVTACRAAPVSSMLVEQGAAGDDHRHAEHVQLPSLDVADREGDDDDGVDLALHRQVGEEAATLRVVGDLVDERVEPRGTQHRQHPRQHRAVEPRRRPGHDHRHASGRSPAEAGRVRRDDVRQVLDEGLDPRSGLVGDTRCAAEHPGDGRLGDAGQRGDVRHVQSPVLRVHGHEV
jgi:hypothetical protein